MIIAGIDYSMSSPAICVHKGSEWSIKNCTFYYLLKTDKYLIVTDHLKGSVHKEWETPEERFYNLADWSLDILMDARVSSVCIEGYAFGAKGAVFQIGENTGVLKQKLWEDGIPFTITPPTAIKKLATEKGNANKEKMWESFFEETNLDLHSIFAMKSKKKDASPMSDIVDSYYLAKYQFLSLSTE
jgi:Holliday junction resolvasome RuvABC endonuclease subunit